MPLPSTPTKSSSTPTAMASMTFMANFISALFLAMFVDSSDICDHVVCGKGTCKSGVSVAPYGYTCECDSGWRRTRLSDTDELYLKFLPCVLPNCSMNYSCMTPTPAPPPVSHDQPWSWSAYDPCNWIYCGEGSCKNASFHMHTCQCKPGAYNLLNTSQFPCYTDCAIGADCSQLGIQVPASKIGSGSSPSSSPVGDSAYRSDGSLRWMILLAVATCAASFLWM